MSDINEGKHIAIITVAGISSRFNKGIDDRNKVLKCLYSEGSDNDTLLYRMLMKLSFADYIIIVGGYKFDDLKKYIERTFAPGIRDKIRLVFNKHYEDLSSGYSLYMGLEDAFKCCDDIGEVLFVEGDLDIDSESMNSVIIEDSSVLTYNREPIFASKAVVLYRDGNGNYNYAFNSSHGLLSISSPFSEMYNSGQTWKFKDIDALKKASKVFASEHREGTNLVIIQEYLNRISLNEITVLPLNRWTNCNTREDYRIIKENWDNENS